MRENDIVIFLINVGVSLKPVCVSCNFETIENMSKNIEKNMMLTTLS